MTNHAPIFSALSATASFSELADIAIPTPQHSTLSPIGSDVRAA
jgi:hypothetical protein